jgi:hypothetical protein
MLGVPERRCSECPRSSVRPAGALSRESGKLRFPEVLEQYSMECVVE